MRENGILFSAPMVRAILAGAKTQTRRVVGLSDLRRSETPGYDWTWRGQAPIRSVAQQQRHPGGCWQDVSDERLLALCPHGAPGDRLWLRETWGLHSYFDETCWHRGSIADETDASLLPRWKLAYRADWGQGGEQFWRPSIHMPRWASRITLEITSVRVERLTAISEEDARAEGVERCQPWDESDRREADRGHGYEPPLESYRSAFERLWDAINGKRAGCAWADDPWVWAIGFRRVEGA